MSKGAWQDLIAQMKERGVEFTNGLDNEEVARVEERFGFRCPPDLRAFLQAGLPCGKHFPNWRSGERTILREWLDLPRDGILFDVEHNHFWLEEWGPSPQSLEDAKRIVTELVAAAPRLIPVYSHRFISDEPHLPGNPVFSVHQTDIIYYGFNLEDYLRHEFNLGLRDAWPEEVRLIRFWTSTVS
jgi:hypothetical protein